jgi:hypothetical protein
VLPTAISIFPILVSRTLQLRRADSNGIAAEISRGNEQAEENVARSVGVASRSRTETPALP